MAKSESSRKSGERRSNREALQEAKDMFPGGVKHWAQDLLRRKLKGQFADGSPAPRLMKLELAMEIQPVNHLVIRCRATLDYGGVQAVRAAEQRTSLNGIPDGTAPGPRTEQIRGMLEKQLPQFFGSLVRSLPERYSSSAPEDPMFASAFQQVTYDGFVLGRTGASFPGAVQHALRDWLPHRQAMLLTAIRSALEECSAVRTSPGPGLAFPSPETLTLCADGTRQGTVVLAASLTLRYASSIVCRIRLSSRHLAQDLRGTAPEEVDSRIRGVAGELADSLVQVFLGRLPTAEVLPPEAFPDGENPVLPLPLHQTLLQGGLSGTCLEYNPLFPDRKGSSQVFSRIFLREGGELELLSAGNLGQEPEKLLSLDIPAFRRAMERPFGLSQRYAMPQEPGELLRFCQEADRLYGSRDWKQLPKPVIRLYFNAGHEISHIRFQGKTVSATGWKLQKGVRLNLRRRFLSLLEQVRTAEEERWNLGEQQRAVLLSLSPAQMYIVRLLAPRNCSQTRVEAKLREGGFLRPSAAAPLLDSLTKIMLPIGKGAEPLVRTRIRPGDWKQYEVYFVSSHLQDGLLDRVPRKPWAADELDLLTPAAAETWMFEQAAHADTPEARWQVFSLLESRFPEAVSVRFVRSEVGQAFFRQVRGADASYMRLFLENLRGCRNLAAQLLPEEAESGAAPP